MKKIACIVMSLCMALGVGCLTGCNNEGGGKGGRRGGRLTLEIYEAGFGTAWLDEIANNYKASTGINVKVNKSYLETEINTKLINDQSDADIVFMVGSAYEAQDRGMLTDLSDVMEMTPDGESKTIKEKMNSNIYDYLSTDDGKIYQLPWANTVSSLCYNETTLNEILGAGKMGNSQYDRRVFRSCRQHQGGERRKLYVRRFHADGATADICSQPGGRSTTSGPLLRLFQRLLLRRDERKFAEHGEIYDNISRLRALEVCEKLFKKSNGYIHDKADRMDFNESQIVFRGSGLRLDKAKAAFIVSGDWMETSLSVICRRPNRRAIRRAFA